MIGRTNVGGGGGSGSSFLAYLQVTTDPNAVITAVNLAGDTFSGTADNTGSLVLNITEPGTYTVTETNGGAETIVVSDYGETYMVEVYAFDGSLIDRGILSDTHTLEKVPIRWSGTSGYMIALTITENVQITISGQNKKVVQIDGASAQNDAQAIFVSEDKIDITNYSGISMTSQNATFSTFGIAIFDSVNKETYRANLVAFTPAYSGYGTTYLDISSYTGEYYVGLYLGKNASPQNVFCYVEDLILV